MRRFAVLAALMVCACGGLEALELGQCGNGVWEPAAGEDCDSTVLEGTCGAPGTPGACRYVCRADVDCPAGRMCGSDGICRLPVRQFVPAPRSPLPSIGDRLEIADLDRDGLVDLIGTNERGATVLFGAGGGRFDDRTQIITGSPTNQIIAGRVGDTLAMFAPIRLGIQVTESVEDRGFRNVAHPTVDVGTIVGDRDFRVVAVRVANAGDAIVSFAEEAGDRIDVFARTSLFEARLMIDGGRVSDLAGPIQVADIDGPSISRTDEMALAFAGDDRVRILGLVCGASPELEDCTDTNRIVVRTEVSVPRGRIDGGIALADADGDGLADLFFGATNTIWIARNTGSGTFAAAVEDTRFASGCPGCAPWPLLIADLDDDGRADFLGDRQLLTTTSSGATKLRHLVGASEHDRWSFAARGDFNRDGRTDVALAERNQRGIEVVLGGPTPLRTTFFFETVRTVAALSAGDFDGDGATDLAFVGDGDEQTVEVLYGSVSDILGLPIEMGRFDSIERFRTGEVAGLNDVGLDFRTDLILTTVSREVRNVSVLFGTSDQRMVAPAVVQGAADRPRTPLALAAGRFLDATEGTDDVVAFTNALIWTLRVTPNAAVVVAESTSTSSTLASGIGDILVTTANLDADPGEEIVVVTGAYPGVPQLGLADPKLYVVDVQPNGSVDVRNVALPSEVFAPSSVRVVDLGASPGPSIVVSYTGARAPVLAGAIGGVLILGTNGSGRIESEPTIVAAPEQGIGVLAVAATNIDSDERIELLVLTERHVFSIERRDDGYEWGPTVPLGAEDRTTTVFGTMRTLDVDRNGLDDLIIANETGCFVYLAVDTAGRVDQ